MFINKQKGYSAFELLMALMIISLVVLTTTKWSNELITRAPMQIIATDSFAYNQAVQRYITTYYAMLLHVTRNNYGDTNNQIVTITPKVLYNLGILNKVKYEHFKKNKLNQYPCTIIYFNKNQLTAFTYYRSDSQPEKKISYNLLMQGLNHGGGFIGLYHDGMVKTPQNGFILTHEYVKQMFIKQGVISQELAYGNLAEDFICDGSELADDSYVVNVTDQLKDLPPILAKDDNYHRYPDDLIYFNESGSHNRLSTDLVMESHPIIFQMNPDCVMNPNNPASMYDWDPNGQTFQDQESIKNPPYYKGPNPKGCRNRQLSFQAKYNTYTRSTDLVVTGFTKVMNTSLGESEAYRGGITADFLQPTYPIKPLTPCKANEVGAIARQAPSGNKYFDYEIGNVICLQSPTCYKSGGKFCWLPPHGVRVNIINRGDPAGPVSCPDGLFVIFVKYRPAQQPDSCSANDSFGFRHKCNIVRCGEGNKSGPCSEPQRTKYSPIYASDIILPGWELDKSVIMSEVNWWQSCDGNIAHLGCYNGHTVPRTRGTIEYITCSSEPSDIKPLFDENFHFVK